MCVETRCAVIQGSPHNSLLLRPGLHGLHLQFGNQKHRGNSAVKTADLLYCDSSLGRQCSVLCSVLPGVFRPNNKLLPAQDNLLLLRLHRGGRSGRCGQSVGQHHRQTAAIHSEGNKVSALYCHLTAGRLWVRYPGLRPCCADWLHDLPVSAWLPSSYSGFFLQSRDTHRRQTGNSK